ncbi:MAG TPA: glycosyltransferase family 39 protein [Chloroflexota bacterium]
MKVAVESSSVQTAPERRERGARRDLQRAWPVALLVALTLASRLPFLSRELYAFDSVNYALALRDFYSVAFHQPHPPGYPLYVAAAKLLDLGLHDPNLSLVLLSVVASLGGVLALYALGVGLLGRRGGLVAALLLLFSPGFWGYSLVAYPYTALGFLMVLVPAMLAQVWKGDRGRIVPAGLLLGLGGGVRWDVVAFLAPLWAVSAVFAGLRRWLVASTLLVVGVVAWAVPMVLFSGGWETYLKVSQAQATVVLHATAAPFLGPAALARNALRLARFLVEVALPVLPLALYAAVRYRRVAAALGWQWVLFTALWVAPAALFYVAVHVGDQGYVLSMMPALCLMAAAGVAQFADDVGRIRRAGEPAGVVAAVVLVVLAADGALFGFTKGPARWPEIRWTDRTLAAEMAYVRSHHDPARTLVLAYGHYRQAEYYLPEHQVVLMANDLEPDFRRSRRRLDLPKGVETLVVLDEAARVEAEPPSRVRRLVLDPETPVEVFVVDVRGLSHVEYGYLFVRAAP